MNMLFDTKQMKQVIAVTENLKLNNFKDSHVTGFVDDLHTAEEQIKWLGRGETQVYEQCYNLLGIQAYAKPQNYYSHSWLLSYADSQLIEFAPQELLEPLDEMTCSIARRINMHEVALENSADMYHHLGDFSVETSAQYITELCHDSEIITMVNYVTEQRALYKIRELRMDFAKLYPEETRFLSEPTDIGSLLLRPVLRQPW